MSNLAPEALKNLPERPVNQPDQYGSVFERSVRHRRVVGLLSNVRVDESVWRRREGTEIRADVCERIVRERILNRYETMIGSKSRGHSLPLYG